MKSSIIVLAVVLLMSGGCATTPRPESMSDPDPAREAQLAFNQGDERLMGLNGVHPVFPGVPGDYLDLERRFGIRATEGTTSVSETYAAAYNRKMLALKGCNVERPLDPCKS